MYKMFLETVENMGLYHLSLKREGIPISKMKECTNLAKLEIRKAATKSRGRLTL